MVDVVEREPVLLALLVEDVERGGRAARRERRDGAAIRDEEREDRARERFYSSSVELPAGASRKKVREHLAPLLLKVTHLREHLGAERAVDVGLRVGLVEDVVVRKRLDVVRAAALCVRKAQRVLVPRPEAHERLRAVRWPDPHRDRHFGRRGLFPGRREHAARRRDQHELGARSGAQHVWLAANVDRVHGPRQLLWRRRRCGRAGTRRQRCT